ncbi:tyrosine-type recombinase/integrase [Mycolicibacterium mageritense]|uniref:tyrosine-type recombinase/integrase n=1 Tax=Mycolicibacterium mageritense TaxID=53462 RepID=UPI001E380DDC|nr:tyrosine-type recombinase/integrase [Mycolicibacterium mageritense]MCC9186417.1 tyrosine-type recombinase/integrase [Mycolicibacterium mageritense]
MARAITRKSAKGNRHTAMYCESDGSERSAGTFSNKKAALDAARDAETLVMQGKSPVSLRKLGSESFGVVAAEWLTGRHDLKPRTRRGYANLLATKTRAHKTIDAETNSLVSTAHLSIAATFGDRAMNTITRTDLDRWVADMAKAGKSVSTIRHHFFVVKAVFDQAVADGRLLDNPADHVKLPTERTVSNSNPGVVDDPDQFLAPNEVAALVDATPWPCAVMVHLAAWSGLRAAELAGLQVGDIEWPLNPSGTVWLNVRRTVENSGELLAYDTTKTKRSLRRVPLRKTTAELLRDYLAVHPRRNEPTAPLFCAVTLTRVKPTGKRAPGTEDGKPLTAAQKAERQAMALAALSVAQASDRLVLDWSQMLSHQTFYKAVFRPAVLRANRLARESPPPSPGGSMGGQIGAGHGGELLPPKFKFHSLRHTYASLCAAAGRSVEEISEWLGHAKPSTTRDIYVHLFRTDDASDAMAALDALDAPTGSNVLPLRRRG